MTFPLQEEDSDSSPAKKRKRPELTMDDMSGAKKVLDLPTPIQCGICMVSPLIPEKASLLR